MTEWRTYTYGEAGLSFATFADPEARTAVGIDASGLRFAQTLGPLTLSVEWSDQATLEAWLDAMRGRDAAVLVVGPGTAAVEILEEGADGHGIEPPAGPLRATAWAWPHRGRSLRITFQRPMDSGKEEERKFVGSFRVGTDGLPDTPINTGTSS